MIEGVGVDSARMRRLRRARQAYYEATGSSYDDGVGFGLALLFYPHVWLVRKITELFDDNHFRIRFLVGMGANLLIGSAMAIPYYYLSNQNFTNDVSLIWGLLGMIGMGGSGVNSMLLSLQALIEEHKYHPYLISIFLYPLIAGLSTIFLFLYIVNI